MGVIAPYRTARYYEHMATEGLSRARENAWGQGISTGFKMYMEGRSV
jgi:hypothetical protein